MVPAPLRRIKSDHRNPAACRDLSADIPLGIHHLNIHALKPMVLWSRFYALCQLLLDLVALKHRQMELLLRQAVQLPDPVRSGFSPSSWIVRQPIRPWQGAVLREKLSAFIQIGRERSRLCAAVLRTKAMAQCTAGIYRRPSFRFIAIVQRAAASYRVYCGPSKTSGTASCPPWAGHYPRLPDRIRNLIGSVGHKLHRLDIPYLRPVIRIFLQPDSRPAVPPRSM